MNLFKIFKRKRTNCRTYFFNKMDEVYNECVKLKAENGWDEDTFNEEIDKRMGFKDELRQISEIRDVIEDFNIEDDDPYEALEDIAEIVNVKKNFIADSLEDEDLDDCGE